jgi:hypothetical protein
LLGREIDQGNGSTRADQHRDTVALS